jgi:DNA-binding CsgD family transcriptional regulator
MSLLRRLAGRVAATSSEQQVASLVVDGCPDLFEADSVGITLFGETASSLTIEVTRGAEPFIDQYQRHLWLTDPLLECLQAQHRAVRDLDVRSHEQWLANPLYTDIAAPLGMVRCMQGPILADGRVTGVISVARRHDNPFSVESVLDLSSVCAHVSVQLVRLRSMALAQARLRSVLTEREVEVSLLVAKGLTNEQIGHVLGVSANTIKGTLARAFRKLGIESRAELVATLFDAL